MRSPLINTSIRALRGFAALGMSREGGKQEAVYRDLVRSDAKALARVRFSYSSGLSLTLEAALAFDRGELQRASELLRLALKLFGENGLPSAALGVQLHLGRLLGDDEGDALLKRADAGLLAMGAVDLERAARILTWGVTLA